MIHLMIPNNFSIDKTGYIITNNHVVEDADKIKGSAHQCRHGGSRDGLTGC